ncbi:MAG TPA: hypothetical protein VIJ04_02145 [Xanthobacteraceae bacterium]
MIRFLLRFLGLLLLATAFVLFVYDGEKTIVNGHLDSLNVTQAWAMIDQHSLTAVQDWIKSKASWAWEPYGRWTFGLPAWAVLAVLSAILIVLGRKKRKLIGYARD